MRKWNVIAIVIVVAVAPAVVAGSASAQVISISHTITITGRVLPTHTIILDNQGNIEQIISNTTEDIKKPKVYSQTVSKETEQSLTPEIYIAYKKIVKPGQSRIGNLYQKPPTTSLLDIKRQSLS